MSHSLTRIWIHSVWSTKNRFPYMKNATKQKIIQHLHQKLEELDCGVRIINGTENHLHGLFLLNQNKSIQEIIKNLKGETSHWINKNEFYKTKFAWQVGYGAFSVSESIVKDVNKYIKNQEKHHRKMSFQEELDLLFKKHNIIVRGNH
ncbi:MAG: IS200/IS605 family transposase [Candidatus Cloacimonadota bacterium]|nr:IS200/IS605 family transposase [Candidatus Cloacimonadota bacterium]